VVAYAKDLLRHLHAGKADAALENIMRAPYFVPDSKKVSDLMREMQQRRVHIAIVSDEYGSTAGLVTIEDLLEEIVGEIEDEYDLPDESVERLDETRIRIDGTFPIDDFNEQFHQTIPQEDFHTVAGFVFGALGRAAEEGDEVRWDGLCFKVVETDGSRIGRLEVEFGDEEDAPEPEATAAG